MSPTTAYSSIEEVCRDRLRWAHAALAGLVCEARREGWIEGTPFEIAEPAAQIRNQIEHRSAATPLPLQPMQVLSARLALTAGELELLWLLAGAELDPRVSRLAQVFGAPSCPGLCVQIVQRLHAITAASLDKLAQLALIEVVSDPRLPLPLRSVRANDRVVEIARGELRLDPELARVAELRAGREEVAGAAPATLVRGFASMVPALLVAMGPDGAGRATAVSAAAGRCGTLRIDTLALSRDPQKLGRQVRALFREACLFDVAPLFSNLDADVTHPAASTIESVASEFRGPVLATAREPITWKHRPSVCHEVQRLDARARRQLWGDALPDAPDTILDVAASTYDLRPGAILAAAKAAVSASGDRRSEITEATIHDAVRTQIADSLGGLATRIDTTQTWDDVVLPSEQFDQLIELVARVRQRAKVLETWGFAAKVGKGRGIAALMSGPPGTGKTMVAGLLAQELGLDLYQVDLSCVVSKYIGETEKNLRRLFDAAETGHAILLFDEADSLFAKRSEVKSSNDRYANLEVNYLLQRMEAFNGICLLTTNHETAIDPAFRRRLAVHLRFPMPDERQRASLWRALLPAAAPVGDDLDFAYLAATYEMSGGYIKNAVLRAAYVAADKDSSIDMRHLVRAARAEYEAMGKVTFGPAA
jgi:SpoVK/Ycf46/Vps4 family AAA+-type ATPase